MDEIEWMDVDDLPRRPITHAIRAERLLSSAGARLLKALRSARAHGEFGEADAWEERMIRSQIAIMRERLAELESLLDH